MIPIVFQILLKNVSILNYSTQDLVFHKSVGKLGLQRRVGHSVYNKVVKLVEIDGQIFFSRCFRKLLTKYVGYLIDFAKNPNKAPLFSKRHPIYHDQHSLHSNETIFYIRTRYTIHHISYDSIFSIAILIFVVIIMHMVMGRVVCAGVAKYVAYPCCGVLATMTMAINMYLFGFYILADIRLASDVFSALWPLWALSSAGCNAMSSCTIFDLVWIKC